MLTAAEAAGLTVQNVMGGSDDWDPTSATEQASAPKNVTLTGTTLEWDASDYVLCWAVCKDGKVIDFTTEPTYTVTDTEATYSVRAANEMGGLGEATVADVVDDIESAANGKATGKAAYYSLGGVKTDSPQKGINIRVSTLNDGTTTATKVIK